MNKNRIVVTMKLFEEQLIEGKKQYEYLKDISKLGIVNVEIREEFLKEKKEELKEIKELAKEYNFHLIYSVPAHLFVNKTLPMAIIEQYINEAMCIDAKMIKFSLGEFDKNNLNLVIQLKKLLAQYNIQITIENDQTELSGKVVNLIEFFEWCNKYELNIKGTFDIGNWYWVGENPIDNAKKIGRFINYIHLKDVILENFGPKTVSLSKGIVPWDQVLKMFPSHILIGLEFPGGTSPIDVIKESIEKLSAV